MTKLKFKLNRRLLAILGFFIFLLVVAEMVARVHYFGQSGLDIRYLRSFEYRIYPYAIAQTGLPAYRFKPNLRLYFRGAEFRTNQIGMTDDRDYTLEKAPGVVRVAVVGGSYSLPVGVPVSKSWHRLLEPALTASLGKRFEVMDFCGVNFYTDAKTAYVENTVARFRPDVVLFDWTANDVSGRTTNGIDSVLRQKSSSFVFWPWVLRPLFGLIFGRQASPLGQVDWRSIEDSLDRLSAVSAKNHFSIVHVLLSSSERADYQGLIQKLVARDAKYVDLDQKLRERPLDQLQDMTINKVDHHPSEHAHALFSSILLDVFVAHPEMLESPPSGLATRVTRGKTTVKDETH